jgi:hypothetical protein
MVNAGLQVVLDKSFTDKFPVHAVTTQDSRSLVFSSANPDAIAYYNMQADVLPMSLRITGSSGGWDDRLDVTRQVELQRGKIIKMYITYSVASGARITVLK